MALGLIGASILFTCIVTHIADGDTFTCKGGTRVRLASIDAPELPGHCRRGRRCAPGDPWAAKAALADLALGRRLTCRPDGRSYDRVVAWCRAGGADLSCAQWRGGHAVREMRYDGAKVCRR